MVVYSEQSPEDARDIALRLERVDEAMRFMLNVGQDKEPIPRSAKLTVYHHGDTDDIGRLIGYYGVYGFFLPRAGNSTAYIPFREAVERGSLGVRDYRSQLTPEIVMFHEYAHYFMFQHAAAIYPHWYVEGFAEVYGTIQLNENGFVLGAPAKHRSDTFRYLGSYRVERMLVPPEKIDGRDQAQAYAMGWLLSHYLSFSNERPGQLNKYFSLLNAGKSDREAAEGAFGSLSELNRDLDRYQRGRINGFEVTFPDYKVPFVEVRQVSEDEAAILPYRIRSTVGVDEDGAQELLGPVRSISDRFPNSIPVLLELAEAEFDAKNYAQSEDAATRVLALNPDNVSARIYLGRIALRRAQDDPSQFHVARGFFVEAARLERSNPVPLIGFYLSYQLEGREPPENAKIALETAFEFAPFDDDVRTTLAHMLLTENRDNDALAVLGPIANNPHGGKRAKKIHELAKSIREGDKAEALEFLAPKFESPKNEEEEEKEVLHQ